MVNNFKKWWQKNSRPWWHGEGYAIAEEAWVKQQEHIDKLQLCRKELRDYLIEVKKDLEKQAYKAKEDGDRPLQMRLTDRFSSYDHIQGIMEALDERFKQ